MKLTILTAAMWLALSASAHALDYQCSPLTGACVPASSPPSSYDQPTTIFVPQPWPRTCPLDGPGAFSCDRRERDRRGR
jgi:hypothetical protein